MRLLGFWLCMMFSSILLNAQEGTMLMAKLSNGHIVDSSHVFVENDDPTFFISGNSQKLDWELTLLDIAESNSNEFSRIDLCSVINSQEFKVDISQYKHIFKKCSHKRVINDALHVAELSVSGENIGTVKFLIEFKLCPSYPIIENCEFIGEWSNEDYSYLSSTRKSLRLTVECQGANSAFIRITKQYFKNDLDKLKRIFFGVGIPLELDIEDKTHTIDVDVDWGVLLRCDLRNDYGSTVSDTIFTTDYITDPNVIMSINQLEEELASVNTTITDVPKFYISNSQIKIAYNGEIQDVAIYTPTGECKSIHHGENLIDISKLQHGIYIMKVRTKGNSYTKKFIRK